MMNPVFIHKVTGVLIVALFCVSAIPGSALLRNSEQQSIVSTGTVDFDPLVNQINVTVSIKAIRALDQINLLRNPSFFVKVIINGNDFTSPVWKNTKYVTNPKWSATLGVPKDQEWVNITIQLWDKGLLRNTLCDISPPHQESTRLNDTVVNLQYSLKTGHWVGDDWAFYWFTGWEDQNGSQNDTSYTPFNDPLLFDPSGYGRLNGCDDNSIKQHDRDCELWFDISQTDPDGDGIPYWIEQNVYHTDPSVNDSHLDPNHDGIPITWDWKWGYDPFANDNHSRLDPDNDGLNNTKEYLTSQWGSDPYRKDLFIEIDQMAGGPNGEPASIFPEGAKDLLRTAYDKHNIVYHLDDGSWGDATGSEMIPFDNLTNSSWGSGNSELQQIYTNYFLHGNENNWRRGVFHYGVVIYQCSVANGNAFGGDAFQISSKGLNEKAKNKLLLLYDSVNTRDIVYASAYMHESGHTLGLVSAGVDNQNSKFPWMKDWWTFRNYKSVMNYGYMYKMVDYSDGSHGKNDFDDWDYLDLGYFNREMPWFHHH